MSNNDEKVIYEKFTVRRTDGRDRLGEKHFGCRYFVLDITHDKHAIPALQAYAESCVKESPSLANGILEIIEEIANKTNIGEMK